jgi:hypothetical protein
MSGLTLVIIVVLIMFVAVVIVLTKDDEPSTESAYADETFNDPITALVDDSVDDPIQDDIDAAMLADSPPSFVEPTMPDESYTVPSPFFEPRRDDDDHNNLEAQAGADVETDAEPTDASTSAIGAPYPARSDMDE